MVLLFSARRAPARARGVAGSGREGRAAGAGDSAVRHAAFHTETRVFLPVLAFVLPFVAAGLIATAGWIARPAVAALERGARRSACCCSLVPALRSALRPDPAEAVYRQAARMIAETEAGDTIVMDRKPFARLPQRPASRAAGRGDHAGRSAGGGPARGGPAGRARQPRAGGSAAAGAVRLGAPPPGFDVVRDFECRPGQSAARAQDGRAWLSRSRCSWWRTSPSASAAVRESLLLLARGLDRRRFARRRWSRRG